MSNRRGRPKKLVKYTKIINVRFSPEQWLKILNHSQKEHLEPSVWIRKVILDYLEKSP
jgi:hypothetical protein